MTAMICKLPSDEAHALATLLLKHCYHISGCSFSDSEVNLAAYAIDALIMKKIADASASCGAPRCGSRRRIAA